MKLKRKQIRTLMAFLSGTLMIALAGVVMLSQHLVLDQAPAQLLNQQPNLTDATASNALISLSGVSSPVAVGSSLRTTVSPTSFAKTFNQSTGQLSGIMFDDYITVTSEPAGILQLTYNHVGIESNGRVPVRVACQNSGTANLRVEGYYVDHIVYPNNASPYNVYNKYSYLFTQHPIQCGTGSTVTAGAGSITQSVNTNITTSVNLNPLSGAPVIPASSYTPLGNTGMSAYACTPSTGVMRVYMNAANSASVPAKILGGYRSSGGSGTHYLAHMKNSSASLQGQSAGVAPAWGYATVAAQGSSSYSYDWYFQEQSNYQAQISSFGLGIPLPILELYFIKAAADPANNAAFGGSITGYLPVNNLGPCPTFNRGGITGGTSGGTSGGTTGSTGGTTGGTSGSGGSSVQANLSYLPEPFVYPGVGLVYPVEFEKGETLDSVCASHNLVADAWYNSVDIASYATGNKLPRVLQSQSGDANVTVCGSNQTQQCAQTPNVILQCPTCKNTVGFGENTNLYKYMFGSCKQPVQAPPTQPPTTGGGSTSAATTTQIGNPLQVPDGSCRVFYSAELSHPSSRNTNVGIEYSDDGGQTFNSASIILATLGTGQSLPVTNGQSYQISGVPTATGQPHTLYYQWNADADGFDGMISNQMQLRINTVDTLGNTSSATTSNFSIDCESPAGFGPVDFQILSPTEVRITWNTVTADQNFNAYQVAVGTDQNDVLAFSSSSSSTLGSGGLVVSGGTASIGNVTNLASTSVIAQNLTPSTVYYAAVRAVDDYGNVNNAGNIQFTSSAATGGGGGGGIGTGGGSTGGPIGGGSGTGGGPIGGGSGTGGIGSCVSGVARNMPQGMNVFHDQTGEDLKKTPKIGKHRVFFEDLSGNRIVDVEIDFCNGFDFSGMKAYMNSSLGASYGVMPTTMQGSSSFLLHVPKLANHNVLAVCPEKNDNETCTPAHQPYVEFDTSGNVLFSNPSNYDTSQLAVRLNTAGDKWIATVTGTSAQGFDSSQAGSGTGTGGTGTGGTGTGTGGTGTGGTGTGTGGTGTGGTGTGTGGTGTGGTGTGTGGTGTGGTGTGTGGTGTGTGGTGTGGTGTGTGGTGTGGTGTGAGGTGTGGTGTGTGGTGTGTGGTGTGGTGTGTGGTGTGGTGTGTGGTGTGGTGTGTGGTGTGGTGTGTGGTGTGGTGTGTGGTGTNSGGSGGGFGGDSSSNCFAEACTPEEEKEFVDSIPTSEESFTGGQVEVLDFIQLLKREGVTSEELSTGFTRRVAVFAAVQILIENGVVSDAQVSAAQKVFPDVELAERFGREVNLAQQIGLVNGFPDGNFYPDRKITLAESYKVLVELMARLDNGVASELAAAALEQSPDWFRKYVVALSPYIPTFDQYSELGQSIGSVFYLTLLREVLYAVGVDTPLTGTTDITFQR